VVDELPGEDVEIGECSFKTLKISLCSPICARFEKASKGFSLISELFGIRNLFLALCTSDHFALRRQSYWLTPSSINYCMGEFVLWCCVEEAIRNLSRYEK